MKFLIITIIFTAGIGFGVGVGNVDALIIEGVDSTTVWVHILSTFALWPMSICLWWLGEKL
jgi:hypothetical protein